MIYLKETEGTELGARDEQYPFVLGCECLFVLLGIGQFTGISSPLHQVPGDEQHTLGATPTQLTFAAPSVLQSTRPFLRLPCWLPLVSRCQWRAGR